MTRAIPSSSDFLSALSSRKRRYELIARKENLTVTDFQDLQSAYLSQCANCTIIIPNKAAQVTMDNCSNVTFQVNEVAGAVELINSSNCTVKTVKRCLSFTVDMSRDCAIDIAHHISQEDLDAEERARRRVEAVENALQASESDLAEATRQLDAQQQRAAENRPSEAHLFVKEAKYPWVVFSSKSKSISIRYSFTEMGQESPTDVRTYAIPEDAHFELGDGPRFLTRIADGSPVTLKCVNNYGDV